MLPHINSICSKKRPVITTRRSLWEERESVCTRVWVRESGRATGRKGGRKEGCQEIHKKSKREGGTVAVSAQLSHLTGLSCWSASVCKIWGTLPCAIPPPHHWWSKRLWEKRCDQNSLPFCTETSDYWWQRETFRGHERTQGSSHFNFASALCQRNTKKERERFLLTFLRIMKKWKKKKNYPCWGS